MSKFNRHSSHRPVVEGLETRTFMSVTPVGDVAVEPTTSALLLPAVQKVRDAAGRLQITDGTSNTILVAEQYADSGYLSPASFQVVSAGK